jgi:hypothetical protein
MTKYFFNLIVFIWALLISFVGSNVWAEDQAKVEEISFFRSDNGVEINIKNIDINNIFDIKINGNSIYLKDQIQNNVILYKESNNSTTINIPVNLSLDKYYVNIDNVSYIQNAMNNSSDITTINMMLNKIPNITIVFNNGTMMHSPFLIEKKSNTRGWFSNTWASIKRAAKKFWNELVKNGVNCSTQEGCSIGWD